MTLLDRLFPSLAPGGFLRERWPLRHCFEDGAPDRLGELFELPELRDVESLLAVAQGDVRVVFTDRSGNHREVAAEPAQAGGLYQAGLSVCLSGVDRWVPGLGPWLELLARDLGLARSRVSCNAYASTSGGGFAKHWDDHEVLILQIRGAKRWRIAVNTDVPFPTCNYVPGLGLDPELQAYMPGELPAAMPADCEEVELRPGSVLFLPRGHWHATTAQEGDSLSLTVALNLPTWLDLVLQQVKQSLVKLPRWREPAAGLWGNGRQREEAHRRLASLLGVLPGDLGAWQAPEVIAGYLAAFPASPGLSAAELCHYRRAEGWRIRIVARENGSLSDVLVAAPGGEETGIEIDAELAPVFAWLGDRVPPFDLAEIGRAFPDLGEANSLQIVDALIAIGALIETDAGA